MTLSDNNDGGIMTVLSHNDVRDIALYLVLGVFFACTQPRLSGNEGARPAWGVTVTRG